MKNPRYTSTLGNNAKAFANIATLYFPAGGSIVDLTYGAGGFWKLAKDFWLQQTYCDIQQRPGVHVVCDAKQTPFADAEFDAAVLDPPYVRVMGAKSSLVVRTYRSDRDMVSRYGFGTITANSWGGLMRMYESMIKEAKRIVRPGGVVVVKGQDDCTNFFVRDLPLCGMKIEDVHVVTRTASPMMRHGYQKHARKNHSYFAVLRRTKD